LWTWDPESAERLFRQSQKLSIRARIHLLDTCPADRVTAAADVLLAGSTLFDLSVRLSWAQKHLPNAGAAAERVIAIMQMD